MKNCQVPKTYMGLIPFNKYYRYAEIQNYLRRLTYLYPDWVKLETYGYSYQRRCLNALYISTDNSKIKTRSIIFVEAGIHAREWIAPAQALYIIDQLLGNVANKHLINKIDWIIIPLINPDGYEYSHTKERFWRKTRSIGKRHCGVDGNRNFDFHWCGLGASKDESSNTYAGPVPFSEPETLALSRIIKKYSNRIKLYLSFHSAAQCFLHPWGYTIKLPENVEDMTYLAEKARKAVQAVNGTRYEVGSTANALRYGAGSSSDWAYGVVGIPYAFTIELPAGDKNKFDMPPERILGVVKEMFEAVKVFHRAIVREFEY